MNTSGLQPIEYNVIIDQNPVEEKTSGGLIKPSETTEREKHLQTRGVIVAVSPMAFAFDDWPDGQEKPKPGDHVAFAQHAGAFIKGSDGREYRVVKDKDVVAVIR
jgi:co-chaperonin GroES (HSP10)